MVVAGLELLPTPCGAAIPPCAADERSVEAVQHLVHVRGDPFGVEVDQIAQFGNHRVVAGVEVARTVAAGSVRGSSPSRGAWDPVASGDPVASA